MQNALGAAVVFILGLVAGSFLNVCIYRLPRGISLLRPRRSVCPSCEKQLKWSETLPIWSWLMLKGRCSWCDGSISFRNPVIELLTAILFLSFWFFQGYPTAVGLCLFGLLLIAATFTDLEQRVIPDFLTWGGVMTGLLLSLIAPSFLGIKSSIAGLLSACTGALTGYLILWGVLEVGRWGFGRLCFRWDAPRQFRFSIKGKQIVFECGDKSWMGEEFFVRRSNELVVETESWEASDSLKGKGTLRFRHNLLVTEQKEVPLEDVQEISGKAMGLVISREVLGWGDVKFLAAIGAFVSVAGVLYTLFFASVLGSLVGAVLLVCGRRDTVIPFGPFLATAALSWVLGGRSLWRAYWSRVNLQELLPEKASFWLEAIARYF